MTHQSSNPSSGKRQKNPFALAMGRRMRAARKELGYDQKTIAQMLGITLEAYGSYERGWHPMPLELAIKLPPLLNRPLSFFLGVEEETELQGDEWGLVRDYRNCPDPHTKKAIRTIVRQHAELCARYAEQRDELKDD